MKTLVFVLLWLLIAASTSAQDVTSYTTNVRMANVRSCAETTCNIITKLRYGTVVTVFESVEGQQVNSSPEWYRIEVDGKEGYLYSDLASPSIDAAGNSVNVTSSGVRSSCLIVYRSGRQITDAGGQWSRPLDNQDEAFLLFTFSDGSSYVETEYLRPNETDADGHLPSGGPGLTLVSGQMQIRDEKNNILLSTDCQVSNR